MRKLFCLYFFYCLNSALHAQLHIVSVIDNNAYYPTIHYEFPKAVDKRNPAIADSINATLLELLDIEVGEKTKSIFQNVWANETSYPSAQMTDVSYQVNCHSSKVLSVSIFYTACGAYCEDYVENFNFDLKTGSRILMDSIFTSAGLNKIEDTLALNTQNQIVTHIQFLKNQLKKDSSKGISRTTEEIQEAVEMYERCLDVKKEISWERFVLSPPHLIIFGDRCSPHVIRALDDIGEFRYEINLTRWTQSLNRYGLSLLK